MKPIQREQNRLEILKFAGEINSKNTTESCADLHAAGADDIKCSRHACDKLDDFIEAVISDTPRAINEEDQVCLSTFAHCGEKDTLLMAAKIIIILAKVDTALLAI